MGVEDLTFDSLLVVLMVLLILANVYNTISSARKNYREQKKVQDTPTEKLQKAIENHADMLDRDKRRLDNHDKVMADFKNGLMATCAGVQALLEHELHNGNSKEMEAASTEISKWLRNRPL